MMPDPIRNPATQKRDARRMRLLKAIAGELNNDKGAGAVPLVRDGIDHGLIPSGRDLPRWLIKSLGRKPTEKLVYALAHDPCLFCKNGLVACEVCDGKGRRATGHCDTCLALGATRCDFCDGAGWMAIDSIPIGFRTAVIAERTSVATRKLKALLNKPLPKPASQNPAAGLDRYEKHLLELNRHMGILENTVVALKEFQRTKTMSAKKIDGLFRACARSAVATEPRMRETMTSMAAAARLEARSGRRDASAAETVRTRAEMYEYVAQSRSFAGTALEHPFLAKAVARVASAHRKKTNSTAKNAKARRKRSAKSR